MVERTFKLVATINRMEEKDLPKIIEAVRKAGRLMHTDAMLILGDNPAPIISLYGEDLVPED